MNLNRIVFQFALINDYLFNRLKGEERSHLSVSKTKRIYYDADNEDKLMINY